MYAHGAHIPQPPHTAGKAFSGLRARIDPEQIPSPVEVAENDEELWEGRSYMTLPGEHVPLSTTDYVSIDQGNSSPRFMRATTWHMPSSSELAESCQVPLAAIIQPFAELRAGEDEVPLVDCGEHGQGPARCERCRGYVNPWCTWVSGGTRWKCNLCGHQTEVTSEYFSNLDANQLRLDHLQRPELNKGTVDFAVTSGYHAPHSPPRLTPSYYSPEPLPEIPTRTPEPIRILLAIDVSREALQCGMARASCQAIKGALYGGEMDDGMRMDPCFPTQCKVGIMTFDNTVHFYDISAKRESATMLVVPDINEEMFCPLRDGMFVDPQASRNIIESLLDGIPSRFESNPMHLCAVGAAIRGCLGALARRGGYVILFQSAMCSVGPGLSEARLDESKLYDTDKEKHIFLPRDEMWRELGEELAEEGVGVSMIVGTAGMAQVDFASLGLISTLTGGDVRYYPRFDPPRDAAPLRSHLQRILTRQTGYNCQARVRVSSGLRVSAYHGTFHQRNSTDLEVGVLHADSAFAAVFEHSSRSALDERGYAHIQCAVLYTTMDGRRRVRVMNLALQVAALAGNVFRYADVDAAVCCLAKEAVSTLPLHTLSNIRDNLTEKCSSILLAYRRNCAAATSPSQLILPEAFKLLPLYTLAIHKNRSLRAHNVPGDVRNFYAHRLLSMPVHTLLRHLYPRFLALHDLSDEIALPGFHGETDGVNTDENGLADALRLPSLMRDSYLGMHADGVYLIDNEELTILWIGSSVSPQVIQELFGVESTHQIESRMTRLPHFPSRLSTQVRNILAHRCQERHGVELKLLIARQNLDAAEIEMSDMLVEDQNCGAMSYIDYLCMVHKQINVALTNNTSISNVASYGLRGTPW